MGFKMKGPSLYKNLHVQREGYKNMDDGRANSSPFQVNTDTEKEKLIAQGFTPADADRMIADGAVTGDPNEKKNEKKNNKKNNEKKNNKKTNNEKKKEVSQEDWTPAYPGADYSKEEIAAMTEEEKIAKIDGYTPKKTTTKKK